MGLLDRIRNKGKPETPQEADQLVLRQLAGLGADLTKPRHVIHYLYFAAESDAREAAEAAEATGYNATVEPPGGRIRQWSVRADATRLVSAPTVEAFRAWFEQLAADHNGEYDGWEAAKTP
jgi:hypothetical protein